MKGLATGSWVRVLTGEGDFKGETTTTFYDTKSRAIAVNKTNYLGGTTSTRSNISFSGLVLDTNTSHRRTANSQAVKIKEQFTYTPQSRLENHFQQVNGFSVELLAHNQYDELGHLISKQVGGQDTQTFNGLQQVDYTYNIRGWLTNINDVEKLDINNGKPDLFAFKINYNHLADDLGGTNKSLYNGNIAETFWRSATDNVLRKYSYQYDNLNRLNNAIYQKPDFPVAVTNSYNESMDYDKNGNISHLTRTGSLDDQWMPLAIDELGYNYLFNRLLGVTDGTNNPNGFRDANPNAIDYDYDDFGNMTHDANKDIESITYNHLNLPVYIDFLDIGNITYIYNAQGQKVMKIVKDFSTDKTTITDYLDGFQYMNNVLQFFPTAEGYVNYTEGKELKTNYSYVYQYKDHLGNIRLSYTQDPEGNGLKVLEENHYYPFGLKHTNYNTDKRTFENGTPMLGVAGDTSAPPTAAAVAGFTATQDEVISLTAVPQATTGKAVKVKPETPVLKSEYKYKYQGQERQDELGLNWDSFKWRNYDYAIGRFMSIDPLAEKYTYQSPYNFSENQVIAYRELEGLEKVHYTYTFTKDQVSVAKTSINGPLGNGVLVSSNHGGKMTYYYGNTIASSLVAFKKAYEGNNIDAKGNHVEYNDHLGNPTIGYGHKIVDGDTYTVGSKISEEKAQSLFEIDSKWIINSANQYLENFDLNQNQTNALYDAAFNMGPGKLSEYKEDGSKFSGGNFFLQFMGGGDGLKKRRYAENILYNEGKSVHLDKLNGKSMEQITDYLNSLLKKDEKKK